MCVFLRVVLFLLKKRPPHTHLTPTSHPLTPTHTHLTPTSHPPHPPHNHLTTTSHAVSPALLENVEHCGGEPEQAASMATQE